MQREMTLANSQRNTSGNVFMELYRGAVRIMCVCTCVALCFPVAETLARIPLDELLEDLGFSKSMKQKALSGELVQWTISEASDRELAVGVLVFMKTEPEDFAVLFREAAAFKVVKQVRGYGEIKGKGTLADFADVVLVPDGDKEAERYLNAEPGETLNLSKKEIAAFRALKKTSKGSADAPKKVEGLVRKSLLERYQAYRAKGLPGIAPYERGGGDQRRAGEELLNATKEGQVLAKHHPAFYNFLLKYPAVKDKKVEEWFRWVNIEVFGRPTLILSHRMLLETDGVYLAADRHYYASREYNSLQQVGGMYPTNEGTLLVYINRVSTEQVGGFGSSVKHPVARGLMGPYLIDMFEKVRARTEKE